MTMDEIRTVGVILGAVASMMSAFLLVWIAAKCCVIVNVLLATNQAARRATDISIQEAIQRLEATAIQVQGAADDVTDAVGGS